MPKDEWGVKRLCPSCSTRFYDLQRDPMTCPGCGATFDLESLLAKKSPSARAEKKEAAPAAVAQGAGTAKADDAEVLDDDTSGDNDVQIDDGLLDDEEDDDVSLDDITDVAGDDDEG